MSAPTWTVDDIVYLRESAARGYLESYRISAVGMDSSGLWQYRISIGQKPPTGNATVADRVNLRHDLNIILSGDEMCTFCEALSLARTYLEAELAKITTLQTTYCNAGTSSGTGST